MLLKYNSSSRTVLYVYFYFTCTMIICFWVTFRNELKIDIFLDAMAYSLQVRNKWFIPLFIDSVIICCWTRCDLRAVVDKTFKLWFTAVRKCPQVKDANRVWVPSMKVSLVQRNWKRDEVGTGFTTGNKGERSGERKKEETEKKKNKEGPL